ncbi:type II toxin-antitoxin system ParD family antitoxin [Agrobacterium sp. a22-2]|uniref:type II toxin-antitoxin system ParD family antitoxin n=1 Tax=Agrobacterium sp. a22-2 TaxID=2283840 RepID=UPI00144552B3|nr:type II toxin-antitoxin system ParD family antitoxin [Agrobacterium sp. a22-2]NKN37861.1 type II toxin-antitoxin system ParD family antitoxin [Agrobacterium sp. a22-2]
MAKTALNLGPHWEDFIEAQVTSGRYASADEVVRDALQGLQERENKLDVLRREIDIGWQQAERGEFAEDGFLQRLLDEDVEQEER